MRVSFIIPVYNAAKYLPRLLESLQVQRHKDWEALFTDDGSSDEGVEIIKSAAVRDGRIRCFSIAHAGSSGARNKGLDNATGDIIGFIDADDFIHPRLIETALPYFSDSTTDEVIWDFISISDNVMFSFPDETLSPKTNIVTNPFKWALEPWHPMAHALWRSFFRRRAVAGIRFYPNIKHQDLLFTYQVWGNVRRVVKLDCKLYAYVQSENSITRSNYTSDKVEANFTIMRELDRFYSNRKSIQRKLRRGLYPHCIKNVWKQVDKAEHKNGKLHNLVDRRLYECMKDGVVGLRGFSLRKMFKLIACRKRGAMYG